MVKKVFSWFYSEDWHTWVGHGLQGATFCALGILIGFPGQVMVGGVALLFAHREIDNAMTAMGEAANRIQQPNLWPPLMVSKTRRHKVVDGIMDWIVPVVCAIIVRMLLEGRP